MRAIRWIFFVAGIYGVLLVAPLYFLEHRVAEDSPPAITHPEYYYGFVGSCLAWQFMYLLIGTDPIRFRTCMLLGAAAKTSFAVAVGVLHWLGRVDALMVGLATPDVIFVVLFVAAWLRTPREFPSQHEARMD